MAGRQGIAVKADITTGTSIKTLLQLIAAANHAIEIVEISYSGHGVNNTHQPHLIELVRQTTAGTMTALTTVKADDSVADSLDTTAQHTATAEPTAGDVLRAWTVHPQTGMIYQLHDLAPIVVGAGDRVGLRVTAADSIIVDAYIAFVE